MLDEDIRMSMGNLFTFACLVSDIVFHWWYPYNPSSAWWEKVASFCPLPNGTKSVLLCHVKTVIGLLEYLPFDCSRGHFIH